MNGGLGSRRVNAFARTMPSDRTGVLESRSLLQVAAAWALGFAVGKMPGKAPFPLRENPHSRP